MSATFFYAVRYLVNGLCETPLRVARRTATWKQC